MIANDRCLITTNSIGSPTSANWYIVYLAAIAIDAVCVRDNKAGLIIDLGFCKSNMLLAEVSLSSCFHFLADPRSVFVTITDKDSPTADLAIA